MNMPKNLIFSKRSFAEVKFLPSSFAFRLTGWMFLPLYRDTFGVLG